MHRRIAVLLALLTAILCLFAGIASAEEGVFELPSSMKTIKAEAFYGADWLTEVKLPSGVQTIGSKAFAYSGLKKIHLPASLTSIADDVFTGCSGIRVTADAGSYAYNWAVRNGYIVETKPLSITATADTKTIITDETCPSGKFTISGGVAPYNVTYTWHADGYEYPQQVNYAEVYYADVALSWSFQPCGNTEGTFHVDFTCVDSAGNEATYTLSGFKMWNYAISANVTGSGNTRTISVTANSSWTATTDVSWINLNKTSGSSGSTTVTATLAANPSTTSSRTGTVTFTCGTETASVTITQDPASSISISPSSQTGGVPDGGSTSVTVTANGAWTASSDSSWLTLSKTSGSGSSTLSMSYAKNTTTAARTATVTVTCGTAKATYKFTQDAHSVSASLSGSGNTRTISVTANGAWTATTNVTWITPNKTSGSSGTSTVTATLSPNPSTTSSRTGTVTFTCGTKTAIVTITQDPASSISVSPTSQTGGVPDGGSTSVTVTANGAWTASSDSSWLTLSKTSGSSGSTTLSMTYAKNTTTAARTATVTVTCGTAKATYKLTQNAHSISATGSGSGNTRTISVTANGAWTATSASWITLNKTSGSSGTTTVTATLAANPSTTSSRTGTVTFTCGTKTASVSITQTAAMIVVTGVSLNMTSYELTLGETVQLTATVSPSNATNRAVMWKSSNTAVATVSSSGVVTAKAVGSTTITVTTADGAKVASCKVTVSYSDEPLNIFIFTDADSYEVSEGVPYEICVLGGNVPYTIVITEYLDDVYKYKRTYTGVTDSEISYHATFTKGGVSRIVVQVTDLAGTTATKNSPKIKVIDALSASINVPQTRYQVTEYVPYTVNVSGGSAPYTVRVVEYLDDTYKYERTYTGVTSSCDYVADFSVPGINCIVATVTDSNGDTVTVYSDDVQIWQPVTKLTILAPNGEPLTFGYMQIGTEGTLGIAIEPVYATDKTILWRTTNSSVVSINSATGAFKGLAMGSSTITALAQDGSGVIATCVLEVRDIGVTVTPEYTTYNAGETCKYTINVENSQPPLTVKCYEYYNGKLKWTYSFENNSNTTYYYYGDLDQGPGTYSLKVEVTDSRGYYKTAQSANVTALSTDTFDPIWPCASTYQVSCLYYYKTGGKHSTRYGYTTSIDISGGGEVLAAEAGTVTTVKDLGDSSFGKYIEITHDNGTVTLYAHLSAQYVSEGERVSKGESIGVMGKSGNASGVHLHFEMRGCDPMKTYFYDKYKTRLSFEQNVYSNNQSFNSDKWICERIADEFYKSGSYYYYKGKTATASGVSAKGVAFIKSWEGCRLEAYDDGKGILTIGYGHVVQAGEPHSITQAQADAYFLEDLATDGEARVNSFVQKTGAVLNQQQYDALVSFFYNLGSAGPSMTTLFTDYAKSLSSIPEWRLYNQFANYYSRNDVNVRQGLFRRRLDEARIFIDGIYERRQWTIPSWCANGELVPDSWYPVELD